MAINQEKNQNRAFLRRAIKVGNSAGVLLPKKFLGSEVRVLVLNNPTNIKKTTLKLLENYMEELRGIYIISNQDKKTNILAVSISISKKFEKGNYNISIIPLNELRKLIKEKKLSLDLLLKSTPIMNKGLISDLKRSLDSGREHF